MKVLAHHPPGLINNHLLQYEYICFSNALCVNFPTTMLQAGFIHDRLYSYFLSQDSITGETIDVRSATIAEGYSYCTSSWQAEESLLTSPLRRSRHLQTSDEYTPPELPVVIPADVSEVCTHTSPEALLDDSSTELRFKSTVKLRAEAE